ncbi:MAG: helix-hairpin-helix domain-containing protein [Deltaproteobacteria bacterium]|nr:helix-hairpin-helix domain-containing protein [Deltaproteobacteria bacterium]
MLLSGALAVALRHVSVPQNTELIEVRGEVARPGYYALSPLTVAEALRVAGGGEGPDTPLFPGDRVVVGRDGVHVEPASDPLLVGLPVDPNTADLHALSALPGVGEATARAVIETRASLGPFRSLSDLAQVPGLSPRGVEALSPYLTLPAEAPPLDLNLATAGELERLPGVGAVLAARIVVDRAEHGPFASPDALVRVRGVGPALVERLRPVVCASVAPGQIADP